MDWTRKVNPVSCDIFASEGDSHRIVQLKN
jgi:hypothetical protein